MNFSSSIYDFVLSIFLMAAFVAVVWIAAKNRTLSRRIKELAQTADAIKEGDLEVAVDTVGQDDLSDLATSMEDMRRRLLENERERQEIEQRERALVQNIAHDIKTPLTSVRGYAEGLIDGVAQDEEKRQKYLSMIVAKTKEMDALINELNDYSESARAESFSLQPKNAKEYFSEVAGRLAPDLESKGAEFIFSYEGDGEVACQIDSDKTERVLSNLAENSIRHSGKEKPGISLTVTEGEDYLQVVLKDDGKGIGQEDLSHIFERTYRGDAARNSAIPGSGLGLCIVKEIVMAHHGDVWAKSEEGQGTAIYFTLPIYKGEIA